MRWKIKTPPPDPRFKWHRWFAWHPVRVDDDWVWLERINRRLCWRIGNERMGWMYETINRSVSAWHKLRHPRRRVPNTPLKCPHGYEDWDQCPACCH